MRLRILPATIFFATLLLTVKVGGLWTDVDNLAPAVRVAASSSIFGPSAASTTSTGSGGSTEVYRDSSI